MKDLKGWPKKHGPKIIQAPMNIFDCRFTKKKIENELGYHIKELQIRSITESYRLAYNEDLQHRYITYICNLVKDVAKIIS